MIKVHDEKRWNRPLSVYKVDRNQYDQGSKTDIDVLTLVPHKSRVIDLPIGIIALLLFVTSVFGEPETRNAGYGYLTLFYLEAFLYLSAIVVPLSTTLMAGALYLVQLMIYPDLVDLYHIVFMFSTAILIARGRWRAGLVSILFFVSVLFLGAAFRDDSATSATEIVLATGVAILGGLTALFFELKVESHMVQREKDAASHERELQRTRMAFVADTHDVISHDLATQEAVIRAIARANTDIGLQQIIGELSVMNVQSQLDLRSLLLHFREDSGRPTQRINLEADLYQTVTSLVSAADAAGYSIRVQIGDVPQCFHPDVSRQILLIARELVTNIVKHSCAQSESHLRIGSVGTCVELSTENQTKHSPVIVPRSLHERATTLGGTCVTISEGGCLRVTVHVPKAPDNVQYTSNGGCRHQPRSDSLTV